MSKYVDEGYFLFFDNFSTTLDLVQNLLTGNKFSCGTIRVNRGMFPIAFKNEKFAVGSSSFLKINENLLAVHWKDKGMLLLFHLFTVIVKLKLHDMPVKSVSQR